MNKAKFLNMNDDLSIYWVEIEGVIYGIEVNGDLLDADGNRYTDNAPFEIAIEQNYDLVETYYILSNGYVFVAVSHGGVHHFLN